jgi:hypothetical protein
VAEEAAKNSGDKNTAYFVKARAAVGEYLQRNKTAKSPTEGLASIAELRKGLKSLEPPPTKYARGHAHLIEALDQASRTGRRLRQAGERGDREAYERQAKRIDADGLRIQTAMQELGVVAER